MREPETTLNDPLTPPDRHYRPSAWVVAQELGDGAVLIHLESDRILELNATAARLWQLLSEGQTLAEAKAALLDEFEVRPETLDDEVSRTLAALLAERMVEPDDR